MERLKDYGWLLAFVGLLAVSLYTPILATEPALGMFLGIVLVLINVLMLAIDIEQPSAVGTIFWGIGTLGMFLAAFEALMGMHISLVMSAGGAGIVVLFQQFVQLYFPIRDEYQTPR